MGQSAGSRLTDYNLLCAYLISVVLPSNHPQFYLQKYCGGGGGGVFNYGHVDYTESWEHKGFLDLNLLKNVGDIRHKDHFNYL